MCGVSRLVASNFYKKENVDISCSCTGGECMTIFASMHFLTKSCMLVFYNFIYHISRTHSSSCTVCTTPCTRCRIWKRREQRNVEALTGFGRFPICWQQWHTNRSTWLYKKRSFSTSLHNTNLVSATTTGQLTTVAKAYMKSRQPSASWLMPVAELASI
jgi:hypothetical protein